MDSEKKILENKYQFKTNYTGDLVNFKKKIIEKKNYSTSS